MSTRYLGERFDIHGGGMDLMFPHHECEIAQSTAALGHDSARYWVHNNMITINGQKMGKSLGNFITLEELLHRQPQTAGAGLFADDDPFLRAAGAVPLDARLLERGAASRREGTRPPDEGRRGARQIKPADVSTVDPAELEGRCRAAMDDDLNSPMVISALFDWVRVINQLAEGRRPSRPPTSKR